MISVDCPSAVIKASHARKPLHKCPDCGCLIKAAKRRCGPCAAVHERAIKRAKGH